MNHDLENKIVKEFSEKLVEIFFDYHIRGCGLADDKTNIICTNSKEIDIKELILSLQQAFREGRREGVKKWTRM